MGTRASEGKVEGRDRKGADEKQKGSDTGQKVSGWQFMMSTWVVTLRKVFHGEGYNIHLPDFGEWACAEGGNLLMELLSLISLAVDIGK